MAKELTPKQKAIWEMTRLVEDGGMGKSQAETAALLGISLPCVNRTVMICKKKLGIAPSSPKESSQRANSRQQHLNATEYANPEVAAAAIEVAAHPLGTLKDRIEEFNEHLKAAGLPGKVSEALVRRLKVKYADAVMEFKALRTDEILEMLGKKISNVAFYLDDSVLAQANARDLMLGLGVLIEKRSLLRGEPTAIISSQERKKMHEILPSLIAEAQRRGLTHQQPITIEGTVERVPETVPS